MNNLNWHYLKYFEVVAEEEHFTKAASRLHITQSALSKSIDNLEKELGFPLFEKIGRNVRLTSYGHRLYTSVSRATSGIEDSVNKIQNLISPEEGIVYFSSIFTLGNRFIPRLISSFHKQYPHITVFCFQESTTNILENIIRKRCDMGFSGEFDREAYPEIEAEPVMIEELVVITSKSHPLHTVDSLPLEEIMSETFVGYPGNTGIIHSVEQCISGDLSAFKCSCYANEDRTVIGMVRDDLGIAIVANNPDLDFSDVHVIHITQPRLTRTLYMVWLKDNYISPASRTFKYFALSNISRIEQEVLQDLKVKRS